MRAADGWFTDGGLGSEVIDGGRGGGRRSRAGCLTGKELLNEEDTGFVLTKI